MIGVGDLIHKVPLNSREDACTVAVDRDTGRVVPCGVREEVGIVSEEHECSQNTEGFGSARVCVVLAALDYAFTVP